MNILICLITYHSSCCPSTFSSSNGCACLTPEMKSFLNNRGNNKLNLIYPNSIITKPNEFHINIMENFGFIIIIFLDEKVKTYWTLSYDGIRKLSRSSYYDY